MSAPIDGLPRRVIPRWRDFRTAAALGELSASAVVPPPREIPTGLEALGALWKEQRSEVIAGELLSASWLGGAHELASEAAKYLLRRGSAAQEITKDLAQSVIEDLSETPTAQPEHAAPLNQDAIRSIRSALRLYPHDALGWCELSRYYAIIGKQEKARRAIKTALSLSPESRYILRSASRCLIHLGDVQGALDVLARAPRTAVDPWLMAAHVAVSNILDKPPRFYRRAKDLINSVSLAPFHTAELNAALGTVELSGGKDKSARKLLTASLEDPTENVIAQAWWAKSKLKMVIRNDLLDVPRSFEANTRALVLTEQWQGATKAAERWLDDEPFSSSPAIELSFILSVAFEEHERARVFLKQALRANPDDLLVINNLAFALGNMGRIHEARAVLASAELKDAPPGRVVALTATDGLLHFREGKIDKGRRLYESAIELAKKNNARRLAALALVFWAKEERRADREGGLKTIAEVDRVASEHTDPAFQLVVRTLRTGPLELAAPDIPRHGKADPRLL